MPDTRQWCFGPFRLDLTTRSLWRDTVLLPLPPKPFAVLAYLVAHAGQVVAKETLLEAVWPNTAVTEGVLKTCLGQIRQVLGETARTPQYIATLYRRGYRFVASVVEYTDAILASPAVPPLQTPALPQPHEGDARPPVRSLPAAERRHLTVLFCDLVGSTALAGHLDPEEYREVVRAYHQTCAAVVQRFDGYVAQYLGDGVLVYFGYPVAHEDDALRAVRVGLDLLQALAALHTHPALPPGESVAVRLGVHTGLVVVDDVGVGPRPEPLALGETLNIAARLQHLAAPNTLVVSAATQHLVAGYVRCKALGAHRLHGLAQPLEVYHVLGPSGVQSRLAVAALHGLTPLVGRAQEVALLTECWARVTEGMGQVVLLTGEAGIGKSRLAQGLIAYVAAAGHGWLEGQGSPYYQHTALYPLIELLERAVLRFDREESPPQKLAKLEAGVRHAGLPLAEVVPLFAALLSLPLSAAYAPVSMAPEQQKQRTLHALLRLLLGMAAQEPLLLVLEDLHWVDPSTLEWLSLLVDQGPTTRLLAVCTSRPEFRPPWTGRAHLTQVTVARLPQAQTTALVHLMQAHRALGQTLFWRGEFAPARTHLEQSLALYDPKHHHTYTHLYGQDSGVYCLSLSAETIALLGFSDQALQCTHEALRLARERAHPLSLAIVLIQAIRFYGLRREWRAIQELAAALTALATEHGFTTFMMSGTLMQGWIVAEQGQRIAGIGQMRQSLTDYRQKGTQVALSYYLGLLAEAYGKGGKPEEGLTVVAEALEFAQTTNNRVYEAELYRLRGVLLLALSATYHPEATTCFHHALAIARQQQAKAWELRAATSLSRLWQQQGKRAEARALLAPVYDWFTEGFDTPDLQEARALLETLG